MLDVDVLILAGGGGTRLWPLSRGSRPKQFLSLPHDRPLIEQAVDRAYALTSPDRVWIITVSSQVAETRRVLPNFPADRIIAEPIGRNSGPACAAATYRIEAERGEPTTIFVCTADHFIPDTSTFSKAIEVGVKQAAKGNLLVTFGMKVRSPSKDFGYIEVGKGKAVHGVRPVARFVEKPNLKKAQLFMKSGRYLWNSGMFAWRSDFFKSELKKSAPAIASILSKVNWKSPDSHLREIYSKLPNISIDYALMEKSHAVGVVPSTFLWSDVGTWSAVYDAVCNKKSKNGLIGKGLVVGGSGNLVHAVDKPVVILGANDLVVVDTPSATLIIPRHRSHEMKSFLQHLEKIGIT